MKAIFENPHYQRAYQFAIENFSEVTPWYFGFDTDPCGFKVKGRTPFMVQFSYNELKFWIFSGSIQGHNLFRVMSTDSLISYMEFKLTEESFIKLIEE
jgi:hypothetical protein